MDRRPWHVEYRDPISNGLYGFFVHAKTEEQVRGICSDLGLDVEEIDQAGTGDRDQRRVHTWVNRAKFDEDIGRFLHHACFVGWVAARYNGAIEAELLLCDTGIIHSAVHRLALDDECIEGTDVEDLISRLSWLEMQVPFLWHEGDM